VIRIIYTLVTARRPGGPGISPHNHLSLGNTTAATTLCGLQVRSPINHQAPAVRLADCQNCRSALVASLRMGSGYNVRGVYYATPHQALAALGN
jgi:hypothetical protein